jgi:ubiquinone/menaquinone biosynthesis C-methylase UbiE
MFDRIAIEKERKLELLKTLPQYDFFRRYNSKIRTSILRLTNERGQTILDAGCGDGDYSRFLANNTMTHVVGIDSSKASTAVARRRGERQAIRGTVDYIVADVNHLPFQAHCFDLVLALAIFHHLPDFHGLDEIIRTMKPASGTLCHEVVLNNPFALAANVAVRLIPKGVKARLLDVADGDIPKVRLFTSVTLEEAIKGKGLRVVSSEREQLFLFILWYILGAFPSLSKLLPRPVLLAMGNIEETLISHFPARSLCRFSRFLATNQS